MAIVNAAYRNQNALARQSVRFPVPADQRSPYGASLVRADILWSDYGAVDDDITVSINLLLGASPLDRIASVIALSNVPFALAFPDTQYVISGLFAALGANSYPVLTNGIEAYVNNPAVFDETDFTQIFFCNFEVPIFNPTFFFGFS